jgi:group I intron endonuclease
MTDFFNCGVYRWLNTITQKSYIGSSAKVRERKAAHLRLLKANGHHSIHFQRAWNKYGPAAFEFEMLAFCPKEDLLWHEQMAINSFDAVKNGYNVMPLAGRNSGIKLSPARRKQQSGISKRLWLSKEFRDRQSASRKAAWQSNHERKKRHGERFTAYNKQREYPADIKTRMSLISKAAWNDPIFRKEQQEHWTATRRKAQADRMRQVQLLSPRIHRECEPFREIVTSWLQQMPQLDGVTIWGRLQALGYTKGVQGVYRFVRTLRSESVRERHNREWNEYLTHPNVCLTCGSSIVLRRRDLCLAGVRKYCSSACANRAQVTCLKKEKAASAAA